MDIKIASWNIDWIRASNQNDIKEIEVLDKANRSKLKIARYLAEDEEHKYDVFALLEADSDKNSQIELEGYQRFCTWRNFKKKAHNYNGVLVYAKEVYKPYINEEVLKEFEDNNTACFLPLVLTINDEIFHCLFVWTVARGKYENFYGYNRLCEVMKSSKKFEKTRDFLNGEKHNVILIGDFNIYYKDNDNKRVQQWRDTLEIMNDYSLKRKENKKPTFDKGSNDHCFVSKNLSGLTKLDVGEEYYNGVMSDHSLICLTISDTH